MDFSLVMTSLFCIWWCSMLQVRKSNGYLNIKHQNPWRNKVGIPMWQSYYISQISMGLFFYLGPKTILFHPKNVVFILILIIVVVRTLKTQIWTNSSRKYAVEFTSGKMWTLNEILRNFHHSACTAQSACFLGCIWKLWPVWH